MLTLTHLTSENSIHTVNFYCRTTCMDKHLRLNVDKVRPDSHANQFPQESKQEDLEHVEDCCVSFELLLVNSCHRGRLVYRGDPV
jgi:hypothetical protein